MRLWLLQATVPLRRWNDTHAQLGAPNLRIPRWRNIGHTKTNCMIGFDKNAWSFNDDHQKLITEFNDCLKRLQDCRCKKIHLSSFPAPSKVAWKVAVYRQALLYRTLSLANGCAQSWNSSNALCSILAARALVETCAVSVDFQRQLADRLMALDIDRIDELVMNRTFATRNKDLVRDHPDIAAVSILTILEKWDKTDLPGILRTYEWLSEFCYPNSPGHYAFFGTMDDNDEVISFYDNLRNNKKFLYVLFGAMTIKTIEPILDFLNSAVQIISKLQVGLATNVSPNHEP